MDTHAPAPKSLIVKGSGGGGLGDKIWALLVAIMYARVTRRAIYSDWRDTAYGDGTQNYFSSLFRLAGLPVMSDLPAECTVWPAVWQGRLFMTLDEVYRADGTPPWNRSWSIRRYSFDMHASTTMPTRWSCGNMTQVDKIARTFTDHFSEYRGLTAQALLGRLWREHLHLQEPVLGRVRRTIEAARARGQRLLGVHVRMTDESAAVRLAPTLRDYLRSTQRMLSRMPDCRIFLATDNRAVYEPFAVRFGPERIVVTDKWFAAAGEPLHKNPACPDRLRGAQDALLDLYVLADCDGLVSFPGSSFSYLASALSQAAPALRRNVLPRLPLVERYRTRLARAFAQRPPGNEDTWPVI